MNLKLRHIALFIASMLFVACAMETKKAKSESYDVFATEEVEASEEVEALEEHVIDAEYEFNNQHIIGVDKLVPMSELSNKVDELENFKQKLIIAQCKSGGRSAQAQMFLRRLGFEKVLNLSGGILKYRGQTS